MSRLVNLAARCWPAALVLLAACGASAGGGGVQTVGGPAGSDCDVQYHKEGCYGLSRMKCHNTVSETGSTAGVWMPLGECTPGSQYCLETADPALPQYRVTECKDIPQQVADVISSGDSTSGQDGVTIPDINQQQVIACLQQKCASQYNACLGNASCKASVNCNLACNGNEACEDKCPAANIEDPVVGALFACIFDSGCVPEVPDTICGDQVCEGNENMETCPQDCKTTGPVCGNTTCESGETEQSCPADCKPTGPKCFNEVCEEGENWETCPSDCQKPAFCGDKICEGSEDTNNCPGDCGTPVKCGDKVCEGNETPSSCPADCKTTAKCGDGTCAAGESMTTCAMDCATTQYGATIQCGWSSCNSAMTSCSNKPSCVEALNCLANCKCDQACAETKCSASLSSAINELTAIYTCAESAQCPTPCPDTPSCGDGVCNGNETSSSCAEDCPTATGHVCDNANVCGSSTGFAMKTGGTCYCDAACKNGGDCCNAAGTTAESTSCAGSTCTSCK